MSNDNDDAIPVVLLFLGSAVAIAFVSFSGRAESNLLQQQNQQLQQQLELKEAEIRGLERGAGLSR